MGNTAAILVSSPNFMSYLLTGDGTRAGPLITNATLIADSVAGPLRNALTGPYATQALMRTAIINGGECFVFFNNRATGNDITLTENQFTVDVDVDAVTPTAPEFNIELSDEPGHIAIMYIWHLWSGVR